jgi:alpha-L-arabinofuranosidase
VYLSKTDRYIDSMAAALYVADALRVFSQRSDLLMANFWSLTGNWWFGAIGHDGKPRPPFHVLEAYRDLTRGSLVQSRVEGPTMETSKAGFVPAMRDVPQVVGHAVDDGAAVRVAVINKHPALPAPLRLDVPALKRAKVTVREIGASDYFERDIRVRNVPAELRRGAVDLVLPKHSFTLVTLSR